MINGEVKYLHEKTPNMTNFDDNLKSKRGNKKCDIDLIKTIKNSKLMGLIDLPTLRPHSNENKDHPHYIYRYYDH